MCKFLQPNGFMWHIRPDGCLMLDAIFSWSLKLLIPSTDVYAVFV